MQHLTLEQAADFLEAANIEHSINIGHTITHVGCVGSPECPARFVLVNDMYGNTTLSLG